MTLTGTSEFQKKRDEHVHMQCCIECPHTSLTLDELADKIEETAGIVDAYRQFVDASCVQSYLRSTETAAALLEKAESTWPEHAGQRRLAALPHYLQEHARAKPEQQSRDKLLADGRRWTQHYTEDVDRVFNLRQEHIHPKDRKTGQRVPLNACRRKDKPDECKHGYFKDHLIHARGRVLFKGLAQKLNLPWKGKRERNPRKQ